MSEDVRRLFVVIVAFAGIICSAWLFIKVGEQNMELCKFKDSSIKLNCGVYVVYSGDSSVCSSCVLSLFEELYNFSDKSFLLVKESMFQNLESHLSSELLGNVVVCKEINPDFFNKIVLLDNNNKIQYLSNISLSYGEKNKILKLHMGSIIKD